MSQKRHNGFDFSCPNTYNFHMLIQYLQELQLNIMLILIGIVGMLIFFTCISKSLSGKRKLSMLGLELSVFLLLISDRFAYIYRGDPSVTGY